MDYIDKKVAENANFIRYSFYELRIKNNLSKNETDEFVEINKKCFEDRGYRVYTEGESFVYQNAYRKVQDNEILIQTSKKYIQF